MVMHNFNPGTQEAEAAESLWVWGQSDWYSKFQDSQSYIERPCLKQIYKLEAWFLLIIATAPL